MEAVHWWRLCIDEVANMINCWKWSQSKHSHTHALTRTHACTHTATHVHRRSSATEATHCENGALPDQLWRTAAPAGGALMHVFFCFSFLCLVMSQNSRTPFLGTCIWLFFISASTMLSSKKIQTLVKNGTVNGATSNAYLTASYFPVNKSIIMKYRTGTQPKHAVWFKHSISKSCPLCPQLDSALCILSGCQHTPRSPKDIT